VLASLFWSAVALGFGASSAAVWWELEVEPHAHAAQEGASAVVTRLPDTMTWLQNAPHPSQGTPSHAPPSTVSSREPDGTIGEGPPGGEGAMGEAALGVPACARRFFAPESFAADEDLESLCEETDLRNVRERVHRAVVRHASGAETPALISWGTLGWYQLPLLSAARHACCTDAGRTTSLPTQHGACEGLGETIDTLATTALACSAGTSCGDDESADAHLSPAERVSSDGRKFAGRVQCLHREGRESAFGYAFKPSQENRLEFERRLRHASALPSDASDSQLR
jgi:hypothetical protein